MRRPTLAPAAELPHYEAVRLLGLLVCFVLIPLGFWGIYDWLVLDRPNKSMFIIPMIIVCVCMLLVLPAKNPDDPPKAP